MGGRALLRLDQPKPPAGQGLRGHNRLSRDLPLCRLGHAPHTTIGALRMSFESDSKVECSFLPEIIIGQVFIVFLLERNSKRNITLFRYRAHLALMFFLPLINVLQLPITINPPNAHCVFISNDNPHD